MRSVLSMAMFLGYSSAVLASTNYEISIQVPNWTAEQLRESFIVDQNTQQTSLKLTIQEKQIQNQTWFLVRSNKPGGFDLNADGQIDQHEPRLRTTRASQKTGL